MQRRKAEMTDMRPSARARRALPSPPRRAASSAITANSCPTRAARGIMNRLFDRYDTYKGPIEGRTNGVLISTEAGDAVPYALNMLEERGELFIGGGTKIYQGMIIGENAKPDDLEVNPLNPSS
jgi:GTP-binding protein